MERPLQPGRTNENNYRLFSEALFEIHNKLGFRLKDNYPAYHKFLSQIEIHAELYPQSYATFKDAMKKLDHIYGTYKWEMYPEEALKRLEILLMLAKSIGIIQLHERYWDPYASPSEPDDISINGFDYGPETIFNDKLSDKLEEFYYKELIQEFQGKADLFRRREARRRSIRATAFYERYLEYSESGFDLSQLERIFNISIKEQKLMNYWIEKILPSGRVVTAFAPQGKGKSNLGSFFIQAMLLMRPEWVAITNIPLAFSPFMKNDLTEYEIFRDKVHFVKDTMMLMQENAEIVLEGKIPCILIDEFDKAYAATEVKSKKSLAFKRYAYIERHWNNQGPLVIYHRYKDIPKELRETDGISAGTYAVGQYRNYVNGNTRRVLSYPDLWKYGKRGVRYFPVPLTNLPYYNLGFGDFSIDQKMEMIMDGIAGTQEDAAHQVLDALKKYRDEQDSKKGRRKKPAEE